MTAITERVLNDALSLPPIERAELIQRLFQSFDVSEDNHIDTAWTEEVESRIEAYDKGLLTASPAEDVLARFLPIAIRGFPLLTILPALSK